MTRYLSAEFIRARGSALQWLPLLALPLVAMTFLLARAVDPASDVTSTLMWQAIYLTGLAAPLATLFGAVAESREKKARSGGTRWRPVSETKQRLARIAVVLLSLAGFHLLNFGATWLLTLGRPGSGRILVLGVFAFVAAVGIAGLGAALARVSNLVAAVAVFAVWQIAGTMKPIVEGAHWWAWPNAWSIRLVLPVMGVHQNATPLEPGSPLAAEKPWPALGLCVVLGAVGIGAALVAPEGVGRRASTSSRAAVGKATFTPAVVRRDQAHRPRPLLAMTSAALTPALLGCLVFALLAMLATSLIYPPGYLHGLVAFAVLPLGAGLLPVLVWPRLAPAWAVMRTEHARIGRVLVGWLFLCVAAVSLAAGALGLVAGGSLADESRRLPLAIIAGCLVALISLLALLRFGTAVALAVTVILAIFSVTLGGDVLAGTPLWVVAFPAWPETAVGGMRFAAAAVLGLAAAGVLGNRALVRLGQHPSG